jgi:mono/diheme cytochrome c family protein
VPRFALPVLLVCLALYPAGITSAVTAAEPPLRTGDGLYAEHCAGCHQPLARTTKAQRSASRIRSANRQFPAMTKLDRLSDAELEAIAGALRTIPLIPR